MSRPDSFSRYLSAKQAHFEAGKAAEEARERGFSSPEEREVHRAAVDYSERAMLDAHHQWAMAERLYLMMSNRTFREAYDGMARAQEAATKAMATVDMLRRARETTTSMGAEHATFAADASAVCGAVSKEFLVEAHRNALAIVARAESLGIRCASMLEEHLDALEQGKAVAS